LVKHLVESGAQVIVADIRKDNLKRVTSDFNGIEVVPPDEIYDADVDVFAPCAMGAVVNDDTLPRLKCSVVCGSANNILGEDRHAAALASRDILYAPDYVVNSGGLINVASELDGYNEERSRNRVKGIYDITTNIFQIARDEEITTLKAANRLAERRIDALGKIKDRYVGTPVRGRDQRR
jgi:leucine dehydrogenase